MGFRVSLFLGNGASLNPKNMSNNSPRPKIIAIKAIILHTFGVQVAVSLIMRLFFFLRGTGLLREPKTP